MQSKRKEPFRFSFPIPVPATFFIKKIGDKPTNSSKGNAEIINISPKGLKIRTALDFPTNKPLQLEFNFTLFDGIITATGIIVWKKNTEYHHEYGINLLSSKETQNQIISELKRYSKMQKFKK